MPTGPGKSWGDVRSSLQSAADSIGQAIRNVEAALEQAPELPLPDADDAEVLKGVTTLPRGTDVG